MMCRRRVRENKEEEEKMNMNMNVYHNKNFCMLCLALAFPLFFVVEIYAALESTDGTYSQELIFSKNNLSATSTTTINRKLLSFPDEDIGGSVNRMGAPCSKESICLFQGPTSPLPNGIPTYTVQIENVCVSGECSISNIHLSCGWFSSARLINPNIFKRIYYDDCLVNNGEPLNPGESLSFQYANSFQYPMSVSSVTCY